MVTDDLGKLVPLTDKQIELATPSTFAALGFVRTLDLEDREQDTR